MTAQRVSTLSHELKSLTDQPDRVPGVRKLVEMAQSAKFRARQVNGIWHFEPADLPAILVALGLTPKAAAPAARTKRSTRPLEAVA